MSKDEKIVKILKKVILVFSILAIFNFILLINKRAYALFTKQIKTDTLVNIMTLDEFPQLKTGIASDVIKSKLVKYEESSKEDFGGGLVGVNTDGELYNETDKSQEIREYRYSGPSVDNYVIFNDETWRIVGVFKDESGNEHVKIVRNKVLDGIFPDDYVINNINYKIKGDNHSAYWYNNENSNSDWTTAGIQYWLNTKNDIDETNKGYLSYLNDNTINMIENSKYYLGSVRYTMIDDSNFGISDTPKEAYINERDILNCIDNVEKKVPEKGCRVWETNKTEWSGNIGLLYPSDYGYSTSNQYWNISLSLSFFDKGPSNNSWLHKQSNHIYWEWLLTSSFGAFPNLVVGWDLNGILGHSSPSNYRSIRPTLYLKSNVKISSGTGKESNPYKLIME